MKTASYTLNETDPEWISCRYHSGGPETLMGVGGKKSYSYETKLAAVRDVIDDEVNCIPIEFRTMNLTP